MRVDSPCPQLRSGFSFFWLLAGLALVVSSATRAKAIDVDLTIVDSDTGTPVVGATVRLGSTDQLLVGVSDEHGRIQWPAVSTGTWRLQIITLGFESVDRELLISRPFSERISLRPQPLLMDEMVVRGIRDADQIRTPVFVESISPAEVATPGADIAQLLQVATGISIRRYGGLGSSSTVSIRGSTSEQVLVYLDGIPLNRAGGGGVDLGAMPVAGIESVDVYRGAVPARFGGNSLGGVLHLRTRSLGGAPRWRMQTSKGSFGAQQASVSASTPWKGFDLMTLIDVNHSNNDFRFFDDNGTEYNLGDDSWASRRNSDFTSLRTIVKMRRRVGAHRLQVHGVHDVRHKGLPGIGNFQSLQTRFDTWNNLAEALLYGPLGKAGGYRFRLYHSLDRGTFKDLAGEVGAARDHDKTTTRGVGARGEIAQLAGKQRFITLFADTRQEQFDGRDLLRDGAPKPSARRRAVSVGGEAEVPVGMGIVVHSGGQWEGFDDRFFDDGNFVPAAPLAPMHDRRGLWGARVGFAADVASGWIIKGHTGRYGRAPSFFELFGDRGAIVGNTDLTPESGQQRDLGLHHRADDGLTLVEIVAYDNRVEDLIRFVQNSQYVSRAHNIGRASLRGIETRMEARMGLAGWVFSLHSGYTYQQAKNRSPFPFEKGNDLPNAPRHRSQLRMGSDAGRLYVHWDLRRESRHFLDRANLRPVPARTIHGAGARLQFTTGISISAEIRNLTDNGVADLWGYPLPGRSVSISLSLEHPSSIHSKMSRGNQ